MSIPRTSDSEGSDYEEADGLNFGKLTFDDIDQVRQQFGSKCSTVNAYLLSNRELAEKRRLIENALQELMSAFNYVSSAYLRVTASEVTISNIKGNIVSAIRSEVSAALKRMPPTVSASGVGLSYADVATRTTKQDSTHIVKIAKGPTVIVPSTISVVVGPKSCSVDSFFSADDTRNAIMKAVKPKEIDLKVNKIGSIRNKAVRIIAESADISKLKSSPALAAAGLEIKEREKLNPRMMIRGVPVDMTSDDLLSDIRSMNLDESHSTDSIKVVYRYPPWAGSSLVSVVIETNSEVRRKFLHQGRVFLSWQACKIEDHLRVLQCYKCQSFGHLAKSCTSTEICRNCAESHETSKCSGGTVLKCHNCATTKQATSDHRAFDVLKCPIIKRRLTEKARNISY